MQAMIISGNGNTEISENWYLYVKRRLERLGIKVIAKTMPDPYLARKEYWLPFIEMNLEGKDEETILIGHSSGAVAILKYLEKHKIAGAVLVGCCYTDLGIESERISGYFDEDWDWNMIKANASWKVLFASTDDPYIPIEEPRHIKKMINPDYYEYDNQGHFGVDINKKEFPELIDAIEKHIQTIK